MPLQGRLSLTKPCLRQVLALRASILMPFDPPGLRAPLAQLSKSLPSLDIPCGYHILASIHRGGRLGEMAWSFWKDKRPEWVQAEERAFIKAANGLKTLQVTPRGGMRIDPEEIRDQILEARELYKDLVQK